MLSPMYNYGSEAKAIEYTEGFAGREVKVTKAKKKQAHIDVRVEMFKRKALRTLAVVAALLAVVMAREAQIDKLCGQISKKEASLENLNAVIVEKEMQLSGQMDITMIEDAAVQRLGMTKPNSNQYVSIAIDKHDGGEVLTENSTQNNGFTAFINKAKILLEYLY